jgi:S-formylglutathione hydrolase FrmB
LKHPDTFAWVGGFSASFRGKEPPLAESTDPSRRPRLLWISCGDGDSLLAINCSFHTTMEERGIPHVWHVGAGEHDWNVWKDDLRRFAPLLFRDVQAN